ncbi:hypothetical protein PHYPSEUDO_012207 [Phytophthora pseudosyringae]|uniref:BCNT-C domain-containing protein n=1 Tax=Phytophthora pseudosyringae TaxID=221518 RepID=A0A8T1W8Q5_9STRA|nr:hypothetical protein PHYPSEUDO_012207 [Phytophthora pseudosyringae]
MNSAVSTLLSFLFVGALWGCTNPLIKRGSNDDVMYTRKDNSVGEFVQQLVGLVKNWQFVLPFALNQSGSVVYVFLLGSADISNAVPICNSLTFVFTAITSRLLGEKPQRPTSIQKNRWPHHSTNTALYTVMGSSSDEDDGDYVPEADEDEEDDALDADDVSTDQQRSVTTDSHVDKLWDDINASTAVSRKAADRSARLLSGLTKKTKRGADKKKKRKLHEFSMPVLSVDVKKSRKDMAGAATAARPKVDRVVKFAGKEYSVSTSAEVKGGGKKGLDQMLESLDEPKKVSTMEKTSLDWDKFKEKEGIEEELTQYTKDGYIEKQEFLQRLDLKRFEIEKAERDKQRKLQQQQPQ